MQIGEYIVENGVNNGADPWLSKQGVEVVLDRCFLRSQYGTCPFGDLRPDASTLCGSDIWNNSGISGSL